VSLYTVLSPEIMNGSNNSFFAVDVRSLEAEAKEVVADELVVVELPA